MVDFISHALWSYAIFHAQEQVAFFVLASLLPDLGFGIPAFVLFIAGGAGFKKMQDAWKAHESRSRLPAFETVKTAYHLSHSWLVMALIALALSIFLPEFVLPFVGGVFLHLALDLFVHKDSPAGQLPLYPLSKHRVKGFIHWHEKKFLLINYAALAVVYALLLLGLI
ncbi:MAG: hypothetical protein V1834_02635 [Candidatus Micrarchaeota archaeon]